MNLESTPPPAVRHRLWIPGFAVIFLLIFGGILWNLPEDQWPNEGDRRMFIILGGIVVGAISLLWFAFLSRFALSTRVVGLVIVGVAVSLLFASVRGIEFTGSMVPQVEWAWTPDRGERLERHLAQEMSQASSVDVDLSSPAPDDMAEYRGPNRDGVTTGVALAKSWEANPPKLLWKHPCGGGYAAISVVEPWGVTIEQRNDQEAVVCYDMRTGQQCWTYEYPGLFTEPLGGPGPRATPTIAGGVVYSLGALGDLVALNGKDGSLRWHANILKNVEAGNLEWAMSASPLVVGDMIYVIAGTQNAPEGSTGTLQALRAEDGSLVWKSGSAKASYASPMLAKLADVEQILVFDGEGISGFERETGKELWRYAWKSNFDINAAQPVVIDPTHILISSNAGSALLALEPSSDQWSVREEWNNRQLKSEFSNAIVVDGYLYGLDLGIMVCLDLKTGKRTWKSGRYGHGQMLRRGDVFVILTETGDLALVEVNPKAHTQLGLVRGIEGKTWNNPTLVGNRLYVRNHYEMAAFELAPANP